MRQLLYLISLLALIVGLAALGYGLSLALPYLSSDAASAAAIYPKATFYGIVSIAMFGLTGLLMALAGSVAYRPKPNA